MAKEALEKFEEQLSCSICLDTYKDPKELQCFHVYCRGCLVKLVIRDDQDQLILACPTCRQVTPIPANGVAGLQSAFNITPFLEIQDSFKKIKQSSIDLEDVVSSNTEADPMKKSNHCSVHADKELELYCETCGELICYKCAIKGGQHHSHDYGDLSEAFETFKGEIALSLEPMEKQLTTINEALAKLDTRCGEVSDQRIAIEVDIHHTFEQIQEVFNVRKTQLIGQLHQMTQEKLKGLAAQKDQIEITQAQLSSCLAFMKESHYIVTGSEGEMLRMKTTIVKQVKELTTTFKPDTLKPNTEADMTFSTPADATATFEKYGRVSTPGSLDPSKCHASGKGLEEAMVGETSTAVLKVMSSKDEPYRVPIKSSKCTLVSELTGTSTSGSVKRRQSQYEISYQPTVKGRHQLHIKVEGQHIRESPFSITAKSQVEKLGTPILTISDLKKPVGVAFNKSDELLVTEYEGHCVSIFTRSGEKIRSFGTHGHDQGQFKHPSGVAVDGEGNMLVTDSQNHRIQKFTAEGVFLGTVGSKGYGSLRFGPLHFNCPKGIAVNPTNDKIYVVDANHRIQILNSDLTYSGTFGKKGSGEKDFYDPCGIACDTSGNVYVADSGNHRIQVFTAEGKFLKMFGTHGTDSGEVGYPHTLVIDANGMVYFSEFDNHRVSVFSPESLYVTSFGMKGEGAEEFNRPMGLAVDDSGVVYVCDYHNCRIQVF